MAFVESMLRLGDCFNSSFEVLVREPEADTSTLTPSPETPPTGLPVADADDPFREAAREKYISSALSSRLVNAAA